MHDTMWWSHFGKFFFSSAFKKEILRRRFLPYIDKCSVQEENNKNKPQTQTTTFFLVLVETPFWSDREKVSSMNLLFSPLHDGSVENQASLYWWSDIIHYNPFTASSFWGNLKGS